jgi:hypothetical protein
MLLYIECYLIYPLMRTSQLFFLSHKICCFVLTKFNPELKELVIMITRNIGLSMCVIILFSTPYFIQVQGSLIWEPSDSGRNPFGPESGPPEIIMINNDTQYSGELRNYIWREGDVNDNIPIIEAPRNRLNSSLFSSNDITILQYPLTKILRLLLW